MKKYPAFIIDRSRRDAAARFTDDFIVCTDKECGFIARAYVSPDETHIAALREAHTTFLTKTFNDATTVVLEIIEYLHQPIEHSDRVPSLLKKAMKAYLYGENADKQDDYDEQIAAIDYVLRTIKSDRVTAALRAARCSVVLLQKMKKEE